jgi:hypothetical protein
LVLFYKQCLKQAHHHCLHGSSWGRLISSNQLPPSVLNHHVPVASVISRDTFLMEIDFHLVASLAMIDVYSVQ